MKFKLAIREGEDVPRGYGKAYYRCPDDGILYAIFYPMPLNIIAAWWHRFVYKVQFEARLSKYSMALISEYERGHRDGKRDVKGAA